MRARLGHRRPAARRVAPVVPLVLLFMAIGATPAHAEETRCEDEAISGEHQNVTVVENSMCMMEGATVTGNVTIEDNAALMVMDSEIRGNVGGRELSALSVMEDSSVGGNVRLVQGSMLWTMDASIDGNLEAIEAMEIMILDGTTIRGNVSFRSTRVAEEGMQLICGSEIFGNTEIIASGNTGQVWKIGANGDGCDSDNDSNGNTFHQNLLLQSNQSTLDVDDNTVENNLQVFGNTGGVDIMGNDGIKRLQCFDNDPAPTGGGNSAAVKEGQCENL